MLKEVNLNLTRIGHTCGLALIAAAMMMTT